MAQYEYQVCQTEEGRITSVTADRSEGQEPNPDDLKGCRGSRPLATEFLHKAGTEGWELVSAVPRVRPKTASTPLFFDRTLFGGEDDDHKAPSCHTLYLKRAVT